MNQARTCDGCGGPLARDQRKRTCSACQRAAATRAAPEDKPADFWQQQRLQHALRSRHFGHVMAAYRKAHDPPVKQTTVGEWLGMTQAQVSRVERSRSAPFDLRKLQYWATTLRVPPALLWFALDTDTGDVSDARPMAVTLEDVHRRDLLKLSAAAVVAGTGVLADAPWMRLSDTLAGRRAADASTVAMIEQRTAAYFRTEETMPARELATSLDAHYDDLRTLISSTSNESLKRRLMTCAGEIEALSGWTLFDLDRLPAAEHRYREALETADQAGDNALTACILGFWSYLVSARDGAAEAVTMLDAATERVRGSAAVTQAWITARRAEELATTGDASRALRSLDMAVTVFDYGRSDERPWTCFFSPSRLGSLAVSTYGRLSHPDTDRAAADLLASVSPSETKVRALVLADLATSAANLGDYDRVQTLTDQSAPVAVRTEASLAIDRLWDLVERLPDDNGTAGSTRARLTGQLTA